MKHLLSPRSVLIGLCVTLGCLFLANPIPSQALIVSGLSVTLGCSSYDYSAYTYNFDRNNTGSGSEAYFVEVTDGAGKVLRRYDATFTLGPGADTGGTVPYTEGLPDYNPLYYRFVSKAGNGFEEQVSYTTTGTCAGLPSVPFAGRGIPAGFVLHTIVCDAAVYDSAGGSPVTPAATLKAGQTWFVNPTAVTAGGKSWTEVFVSGTTNGFILTSCVQ